jgi:MFS family permease
MISFSRYVILLAIPDVRQAFVRSFVGRIPIGIAGLAILLLLQSVEGSYVQAGIVAACYVAGLAIAAPLLGRLIDTVGPRRVLSACALVYPTALFALVWSASNRESMAGTLALAALAGASFPPVTACQRAWLRQKLGDDGLFTTALSLDALVVEVVFIAGPMLVALLVALISPAAAVAAAGICGFMGSLLFIQAQALKTWKLREPFRRVFLGPLGDPNFVLLLCLVTCYATIFGLVEIGVTAYAAESGRPAMAGVLLGIMSVGSAFGALAYGSRLRQRSLSSQFSCSLALMSLGIVPLALLAHPVLFAVSCVIAGVAMTPTLIIQSTLVAKTVRTEYSTEGFTWSATALLAGVGIGLALGGLLLEQTRVATLFWVAVAFGAVTSLLARFTLRIPKTQA